MRKNRSGLIRRKMDCSICDDPLDRDNVPTICQCCERLVCASRCSRKCEDEECQERVCSECFDGTSWSVYSPSHDSDDEHCWDHDPRCPSTPDETWRALPPAEGFLGKSQGVEDSWTWWKCTECQVNACNMCTIWHYCDCAAKKMALYREKAALEERLKELNRR